MNMVEKILARKSGQKSVTPGDVVLADVDLMLMHDLSANFVMKVFENEMEGASIADPSLREAVAKAAAASLEAAAGGPSDRPFW